MLIRRLLLPFWLALAVVLGPSAQAHRLSDAVLRLSLDGRRLSGRIDVPIRDLALVLPLDSDADGSVTWAELRTSAPALRNLIDRDLALQVASTSVVWRFGELQVAEVAGEACASLPLGALLPAPGELRVRYELLFATDPQHRGLLTFEEGGRASTFVFAPARTEFVSAFGFPDSPGAPAPSSFPHFVAEGTHHIWIGLDHVLFLLALLLPSVMARRNARGVPVEGFGGVTTGVLRTITAFTVAHSLTLALAALDLVRVPSRAVETVIAASVAVAALNNLIPFFRERTWWVAFGFGLVHGFGFASVLSDLQLPAAALVRGLLGFNLGVELGQLAIVAVFLPVAFALRRGWFYRRLILQTGSVAILVTALVWAFERGTGAS